MTPELPLEIVVQGIPVSLQGSSCSKTEWKETIKAAAGAVIPGGSWALTDALAVTIYYFQEGQMIGDVDNIVNPSQPCAGASDRTRTLAAHAKYLRRSALRWHRPEYAEMPVSRILPQLRPLAFDRA